MKINKKGDLIYFLGDAYWEYLFELDIKELQLIRKMNVFTLTTLRQLKKEGKNG